MKYRRKYAWIKFSIITLPRNYSSFTNFHFLPSRSFFYSGFLFSLHLAQVGVNICFVFIIWVWLTIASVIICLQVLHFLLLTLYF